MYARATTYRGVPEDVEEAIVHWEDGVPSIREFSGSRGAFLLVDRSAGTGIGVTLWENAEAMQASRDRAARLAAAGSRVRRRVGTRVRGRRLGGRLMPLRT